MEDQSHGKEFYRHERAVPGGRAAAVTTCMIMSYDDIRCSDEQSEILSAFCLTECTGNMPKPFSIPFPSNQS